MSEDTIHDHQQIADFEKRAFSIFDEMLPHKVKSWKRFSDGCTAQFWSRFVVPDLFAIRTALQLNHVSFDRFEAHEGKSISDTLGSITKCAYGRGILKHDEDVSTLSEVVDVIRSEIKPSTRKFDFLIVEEFGSTNRKLVRPELEISKISTLHSFNLSGNNLIGKQWTCASCTVSSVCDTCKAGPFVSKYSDIRNVSDLDTTDEDVFFDESDEGQSDQSDSDKSSEDEPDIRVRPGNIVWGLIGRIWYPARVCTVTELPENIKGKFKNISNKHIVQWYGDNLYSLVGQVEMLGETQMDAKRASRSAEMQKLYNMALADLCVS